MEQGYRPSNMESALALRNMANSKVAPQNQNVTLTHRVDQRAALNSYDPKRLDAITNNGRYNLPLNAQPVKFPSPLITYDKDEVYWRNRQQTLTQATKAVNQNTSIIPGAGQAYLDSQFFAFAQREREKQVARMFEQFVYSQIDLSTPAKRQYWESKFPEYTETAYKMIEKQKELELEIAKIEIRGYHNRKDMMLKYLYDKGLLTGYVGQNVSVFDQEWLLQNYQNMEAQIGLPQGEPGTESVPFPAGGIHVPAPSGELPPTE